MPLAFLLQRHQTEFGPVLPVDLNGPAVTRLDLTDRNPLVAHADLRDTTAFEVIVNAMLAAENASPAQGVGAPPRHPNPTHKKTTKIGEREKKKKKR
jgi:hypothetical protein